MRFFAFLYRAAAVRFDPDIHQRQSIRLSGYDYSSAGFYFVTICVQNRECLLGEIAGSKLVLNDAGLMVEKVWHELLQRFPGMTSDTFVVMPNHFHGIIIINDDVGRPPCLPRLYRIAEERAPTGGCPYGGIVIARCCPSVQIIDHRPISIWCQ
ncbi:MAG: transposase [Thermodesulfobacteriota bacterium]|nr:transposase [Thermodesulfobacteriota bacterium]